jgi:hypothetical protein
LKYLNVDDVMIGKTHNIWYSGGAEPYAVNRSCVKAKLACGTYTLQKDRSKFSKHSASPTCQLCKSEPEDRLHNLLQLIIDCSRFHFFVIKPTTQNWKDSCWSVFQLASETSFTFAVVMKYSNLLTYLWSWWTNVYEQHFITSLFNDLTFLIVHRFNIRIVCLLEVNSTCVVFHCVDWWGGAKYWRLTATPVVHLT